MVHPASPRLPTDPPTEQQECEEIYKGRRPDVRRHAAISVPVHTTLGGSPFGASRLDFAGDLTPACRRRRFRPAQCSSAMETCGTLRVALGTLVGTLIQQRSHHVKRLRDRRFARVPIGVRYVPAVRGWNSLQDCGFAMSTVSDRFPRRSRPRTGLTRRPARSCNSLRSVYLPFVR
jgi:hypothetical protein